MLRLVAIIKYEHRGHQISVLFKSMVECVSTQSMNKWPAPKLTSPMNIRNKKRTM